MPLLTEDTTFTRDVLGRYLCNTFEEARVTFDPNARAAAGLPSPGDLRPFDIIIVGGGTFGSALAQQIFFSDTARSHRILVLEGGPFFLPEHVQNLPMLGLNAGPPVKRTVGQAQPILNEVWGLAWHSELGFPGLAYCIGGRSLYWGGWSPQFLDSEMPPNRWPAKVIDDLNNRYFPEAAEQIGVDVTNDFIFGELHTALRAQLLQGIKAGQVTGAVPLNELPLHLVVPPKRRTRRRRLLSWRRRSRYRAGRTSRACSRSTNSARSPCSSKPFDPRNRNRAVTTSTNG